MSDFLPHGMRLAAEKLSVLSRIGFRLETVSASSASPGQIITINLPANVLIHASSFKKHANVKTTSVTNDAQTVTVHGKLPQDSTSLIRLSLPARPTPTG
eukprot:3793173-Pleurochrysis_carterae.AAC.1